MTIWKRIARLSLRAPARSFGRTERRFYPVLPAVEVEETGERLRPRVLGRLRVKRDAAPSHAVGQHVSSQRR